MAAGNSESRLIWFVVMTIDERRRHSCAECSAQDRRRDVLRRQFRERLVELELDRLALHEG